jgi:hypothetical protein
MKNTKGTVRFTTFYGHYTSYCEQNGYFPLEKEAFREAIVLLGCKCVGCHGFPVRLPYDGHLDKLLDKFLDKMVGDPPIASMYIAFGAYCRKQYNMRSFELDHYIDVDEFELLVSFVR